MASLTFVEYKKVEKDIGELKGKARVLNVVEEVKDPFLLEEWWTRYLSLFKDF